jgi:hypothetical protein
MMSQNLASNFSSHDDLKIRVRCGLVSGPDALHGGLGYSHMLGHRTGTPPSQAPGGLTASLKILPLSDGLMRSGRQLRANSAKLTHPFS